MRIRLRDEISPQINFLIIQRRFGARLGVPYFHMHIAISHLAFPTRFQASDRSSHSDEVPVKGDDSDFLSKTRPSRYLLLPLFCPLFSFGTRYFLQVPRDRFIPTLLNFFSSSDAASWYSRCKKEEVSLFIWKSFCSKFVLSSASYLVIHFYSFDYLILVEIGNLSCYDCSRRDTIVIRQSLPCFH